MIYYLERHINLDSDEHGPAAHKILNDLIDGDQHKAECATQAAIEAIKNRINLWDGVINEISTSKLHKIA